MFSYFLKPKLNKILLLLFFCFTKVNALEYKLPSTPAVEIGAYSILYTHSKYIGVSSRIWMPYKLGLQIGYSGKSVSCDLSCIILEKNKYRGYIGIGACDWLGYKASNVPIFLLGAETQFLPFPLTFSADIACGNYNREKWEMGFNLSLYKTIVVFKPPPEKKVLSEEEWRDKKKNIVTGSAITGAIFAGIASTFSWWGMTYGADNAIMSLLPISVNTLGGAFCGSITAKMANSWVKDDNLIPALLKGSAAGIIGAVIWDAIFLSTGLLYQTIGGEYTDFGNDEMANAMAGIFFIGLPIASSISVGIIGGSTAGVKAR